MNKPRILFVDDEANVLQAYRRSLRGELDQWELSFASNPVEAWKALQKQPFDALVTDVRMPGMTGIELLKNVKQNSQTTEIPVIIVTGESDRNLKRHALDLNAADLLNKPLLTEDLIARLRSVLRTQHYANELKQNNALLEQRVRERTRELEKSRIDIIWRLAKAAEFRDEDTGNHTVRVGSYSRAIGRCLGLSDVDLETLFLAAPLHDIGKIGVPDAILRKPGRLTDSEWTEMRRHCEYGVSILQDECTGLTTACSQNAEEGRTHAPKVSPNPVIRLATSIAASHHEKWNGDGYPNQLSGSAIPLEARIVAIADVYDALRSERPYKSAYSVERTLDILRDESGSHFDPKVVIAFFEVYDEIASIENSLVDATTAESMDCVPPVVVGAVNTELPSVLA